jgi:hypothetical protein
MTCPHCTARHAEDSAKLRGRVTNLTATVDSLSDALHEAESLCLALANKLAALCPDFVEDTLDDEERELWDSVQPFGTEEDDDEG